MEEHERELANAEWRGMMIAKLDGLHTKLDDFGHKADAHELRIRQLEDFKSRIVGAGLALAVVWTVITTALSYLIAHNT